MKHTLIILLLMSASLSAQTVKFTQIEPSTTKFALPVAEKQIPGQTGKYFLKYMTLAELQDSVGCCTDSIFMIGDTITLRDGSGYVVPGATYYITSANGQKKGDFLKPFYINENLAKNQIWNGNTWIDFDKDVFSTNELGTYFDGTITTPIQPKKGDLWFNTGISVPQLQIFTGTSWVQVEYFDQTNYTSLATDAPNNTVFIIQPNTGATPNTITTETKTPITLDYEMIDAQNWKQTIGIDTAALVNIILDSIPPPTPSADSTIVSAGHGITVTEAPSNTFTVKADTSALATNYDITLKQDNLISGTNIKTVNGNSLLGSGNVSVGTVTSVDINPSNGIGASAGPITSSGIINVWNTKPFDYIGLQAGLGNIYQLGNGQTLNITAPAPFSLTRLNGSFNLSLPAANASTDGYLTYQDWTTFNGKVGGNGSTNTVAKFTSNNTIGSSNMIDDGQKITISNTSGGNPAFVIDNYNTSHYIAKMDIVDRGSSTNRGSIYFNANDESFTFENKRLGGAGTGDLNFKINNGNSYTALKCIGQTGGVQIPSLSGNGSRFVKTSAIGNISAGNISLNDIDISNKHVPFGSTSLKMTSSADFLYDDIGKSLAVGNQAWAGSANLDIYHNHNASTYQRIRNDNSGNSARAYIETRSDAGTFAFGINSSTYVGEATNAFVSASNAMIFSTGAVKRLSIASNGNINVSNLAGSGNRMVIANSSGDLSTQSIPTSPQTWADFGTNMQAWNSTGTYGSGKDVGIGIQPTADLDVNGTTRLRGAIYDSANSTGTSGQVLTSQGTGAWTWTTLPIVDVVAGTNVTVTKSNGVATVNATGGTGTVTSVAVANGGGLTVSGSPVTTSGTITLTAADQSATNELQNLTLSGQALSITSGTGVTLPIIDVVAGANVTVSKSNGVATVNATSVSYSYGKLELNNTNTFTIPSTATKINFNSGGSTGISASATNDQFTIPSDGVYELICNIGDVYGTSNRNIKAQIYKNAVAYDLIARTNVNNDINNMYIYGIEQFLNGDLIDIRINYDTAVGSGTDLTCSNVQFIIKKR